MSGKLLISTSKPVDSAINTVKPGGKRDYEDAYFRVLQDLCSAHWILATRWETAGA
jgi:hypothetical protein